MNFNELFPSIFYINLDDRTDRNAQVKKEFKKLGISPTRHSGHLFSGTGFPNIDGAIGCMLSHLDCLNAGLSNNTNVFIFEDDFMSTVRNPKKILDEFSEELSGQDWDMAYVSGNILRPCNQISPHLAKLSHCQSTVAYGVNLKFIPKLLSYFQPNVFQAPIDVIYADRVIPENNCFISIPMMGIQRDSYSDIEKVYATYTDYLQERYDKNLILLENGGK